METTIAKKEEKAVIPKKETPTTDEFIKGLVLKGRELCVGAEGCCIQFIDLRLYLAKLLRKGGWERTG